MAVSEFFDPERVGADRADVTAELGLREYHTDVHVATSCRLATRTPNSYRMATQPEYAQRKGGRP